MELHKLHFYEIFFWGNEIKYHKTSGTGNSREGNDSARKI